MRGLFVSASASLCCLFVVPSSTAWARPEGISGYSGKQGGLSCNVCHLGGNEPSIELSGPTRVGVGTSSTYTLTVSGGAAGRGGINAAVDNTAAKLRAGEGTRVLNGEIVHAAAPAFESGRVTFGFALVAPPSEGRVTLYASALSANGNGASTGDLGANTVLSIEVVAGLEGQAAPPPTDEVAEPEISEVEEGDIESGTEEQRRYAGLVEGTVGCAASPGEPTWLLLLAVLRLIGVYRRHSPTARPARATAGAWDKSFRYQAGFVDAAPWDVDDSRRVTPPAPALEANTVANSPPTVGNRRPTLEA